MITKSPTFTTLVSIVLCITHVLILVLLILWLYITFVITPSKPLDYPVTLSINNTLRWGVALVNPVDVTISSFTYFILPNINVFIVIWIIKISTTRVLIRIPPGSTIFIQKLRFTTPMVNYYIYQQSIRCPSKGLLHFHLIDLVLCKMGLLHLVTCNSIGNKVNNDTNPVEQDPFVNNVYSVEHW